MFEANLEIQRKVDEILQNSDTKDWIETIGSESAQINYIKHLAEYLLYRKSTISELVSNFKKDENEEIKNVQSFVNQMLKRLAPGTVANYVSAIKSRMQYDGIPFTRSVKIPNRTYHPTVENEVVPTKDQIITFLRNGKHATQVIVSLIAFLGVRFNVMADLRIKDFPEMRIAENEIIFEKMPTRVKIRKELSKNGKEYQTFLIETGCMILKNSLEIRMKKGEKLDSESLLVPTECDKTTLRQRAKAISRRLNTVFDKVKYGSRPYSLKNFFATALLNSGLEQNWQTFFMGHTGPVQNTYSVRRQQPAEQIEQMRKIFKEKIEPHLIPQDSNVDASVRREFKKYAKEAFGVEISDDADTNETISEIAEIYRAGKNDLSTRDNVPKIKQKSIDESELDAYLANSWEFQGTLASGKIIVKQILN